jgi:hypothetical protein
MDFVIMPVYYEYHSAKLKNSDLVAYSIQFADGPTQIAALQTLKEQRSWKPITLDTSGMVHLSFGAILGVSAYTRRRRKEDEEDDQHT